MVLSSLVDQLRGIVGDDGVLADSAELLTYESDGFPIAKALPQAVVFPRCTQQAADCVKAVVQAGIPVVPRGSGTGLAGGCAAYGEGIILCTSKMNRILDVDLAARYACVEAGVRNTQLTDHVNRLPGGEHLHFAPDPSSQKACTIGGNSATNAGGLHTLKYGVTTNHVLGLEGVLADGTIFRTRTGGVTDSMGPDLPALLVGNEGTLALFTKIWVRLTPRPRAFRTAVVVFRGPEGTVDAGRAVAQIIATGILPGALEMMDGAMVRVVEEAFHYGFHPDAQALLLIELDDPEAVLDQELEQVLAICRSNGASEIECSSDAKRRAELWSARKRAFGAVGRISPSYCTQDACVPRSALPAVLEKVGHIGKAYGLIITNVFHAGDGNVHPILLFDENDPEQVQRVMKASYEILEYCMSVGGALTGEHGVGVEKLPLMSKMFDPPTMDLFARIKKRLDPLEALNPGKLIPSARLQVDLLKPVAMNIPGGAM